MFPQIQLTALGLCFLALAACSTPHPVSDDEATSNREPASISVYSNCTLDNYSAQNGSTTPRDFPVSMIKISQNEISLEISSTSYSGSLSKPGVHSSASGRPMTRYARLTDPGQKKVASFWVEKIDDGEIVMNQFGLESLGQRNPKQVGIGQSSKRFLKAHYPKGTPQKESFIRCTRQQ